MNLHHVCKTGWLQSTILVFICMGCLCAFTSKAQDSEEVVMLDSLKHALDTAKTERSKLDLRYNIGVVMAIYTKGFWDSLIDAAHKAGAIETEIASLDRIGFYLNMQGEVNSSIIYLNRAVRAVESTGVQAYFFNPMYHLTDAYLVLGDIKNALDYGFRASKIAEESKNQRNIVLGYSQLGRIYARIGYLRKALKLHTQALALTEKSRLGTELEALLVHGIATDYYELGDTANALKYFSRCVNYVDSFTPSGMQAALYNGTGIAYAIQHQPLKAEKYYQAGYKVAQEIGSKVAAVNSLTLLAASAYDRKDYKEAKAHALAALALSKSTKNKTQVPKIALLLENIYDKEKNYKEALHYSHAYLLYKDSLINENIQNQAIEKEYKDELEQKEYGNRLLLNRNRIQNLILKQKNYLATGLLTGMLLLTVIFILFTRQHKIKAARQKLYLEQKLLRTQMNPHFIFNALQAIQNVVLNDNKQQAIKYLSSFAGLTREVLNNSKEDLITISREIALVEHYLLLQKLRFGDRFSYKVLKEGDISDDIFVPPMLGQPFIENAVEHGMKNIGCGGEIEVRYTLTGDSLNIKITDNGHGMHIHQRNNKQHQSMAIAITKERIRAMNKKQKLKTGFEIKDAFPGQSGRKGVCIMFNLPVNLTA
jgi:tetratricopeptide (TPR) repeat protein